MIPPATPCLPTAHVVVTSPDGRRAARRARGAMAERARIVGFLRNWAGVLSSVTEPKTLRRAADRIDRGDHEPKGVQVPELAPAQEGAERDDPYEPITPTPEAVADAREATAQHPAVDGSPLPLDVCRACRRPAERVGSGWRCCGQRWWREPRGKTVAAAFELQGIRARHRESADDPSYPSAHADVARLLAMLVAVTAERDEARKANA